MSDRILVLHEGRITAEISRDQATEERVMFAATGNVATGDDAATGPTRERGLIRWLRAARRPARSGGPAAAGCSRSPASAS